MRSLWLGPRQVPSGDYICLVAMTPQTTKAERTPPSALTMGPGWPDLETEKQDLQRTSMVSSVGEPPLWRSHGQK